MRPTLSLLLFLTALALAVVGCKPAAPTHRELALFAAPVPQSEAFKADLDFLESKRLLGRGERKQIETQLAKVEETLGVPRNLLWCVLFQESRFDALKNALDGSGSARGLGQFTDNALQEINEDTDQYDERTHAALEQGLKPGQLPLSFALQAAPSKTRFGRLRMPAQMIPRASYFHSATAVHASGAYLNNRYWQIRRALDQQGVQYDADLLWLYAAAAYNKGARTVFSLLTHQLVSHGQSAMSELMQNPRLTYLLLTDPEVLDRAFAELWSSRTRKAYVEEMTRNMAFITGCLLPGGRL